MSAVIYNCPRCKVGRRVEYPLDKSGRAWRTTAGGQRVQPGAYARAWGGGKPTVYGGDTEMGLCPTCGQAMKYGQIEGRFIAEHKCDARCSSARGHNCECSCGGENHGADWAAA